MQFDICAHSTERFHKTAKNLQKMCNRVLACQLIRILVQVSKKCSFACNFAAAAVFVVLHMHTFLFDMLFNP